MALRNLVAACCRRSGAGTPVAAATPSRFLATTRNQNGIAVRRFPYDGKSIGDLLKRGEEEIMRRAIEWASRGINDAKSTRELLERVKIEEKKYKETGQVVIKRSESHGMVLLLLCFSYCCSCRDGLQAMRPSLFKFKCQEDTSNCICCLCIVDLLMSCVSSPWL